MICDHPLADIEGFDPTFNLVHFDSWSDWEEHGWIAVHEKNGQYYCQEYAYCVMCGCPERWAPEPVSEDEALERMLEWERESC